MENNFLYNFLSWENSFKILYMLQLRVYKCVFVANLSRAFAFQKLIILSKSSRLLAIREMTQINANKGISGIDGKTCLSFIERFQLNEFLRLNVYNWFPSSIKKINTLRKDGISSFLYISTISDRCWQCMVKFSLEPAHEACFNIRNLGYRPLIHVHQLQKLIFHNLRLESFGKQKRIFIINIQTPVNEFDYSYLLKKLVLPRGLKLGIFRSLNLGFKVMFTSTINYIQFSSDLSSLLCNIFLDGIETVHPSSVRFGNQLLIFLKPLDNEIFIFEKVKNFLFYLGFQSDNLNPCLFSSLIGFDILGWNFRVSRFGDLFCVPSFKNYHYFLSRIKHIINNSNFGAVCFLIYMFKIFFKLFILNLNVLY